MGFNRHKMEDERRRTTEKEARLIAAWNERQLSECRYCARRQSGLGKIIHREMIRAAGSAE
jgi:hypothetical protein